MRDSQKPGALARVAWPASSDARALVIGWALAHHELHARRTSAIDSITRFKTDDPITRADANPAFRSNALRQP
jgi:hypothetical protein